MKVIFSIVLLLFSGVMLVAITSQQPSVKLDTSSENNVGLFDGIYGNEFGNIILKQKNDSIVSVVFSNVNNDVYETEMKPSELNLLAGHSSDTPYLKWNKYGGLVVYPHMIHVVEYSSMAHLGQHILIEKVYERPFFRLNDTVTFQGEILHSKGGQTINGIYVVPRTIFSSTDYVDITGIIKKEKYPREYYSTADGPQGMFSDTNEVHYRLVIEPIKTDLRKKTIYTGTTKNINGQAAFIWDFADSEAYYLDNHQPWTQKEEGKKISIEAVLIQFEDGQSVLKNWRIIE